MCNNWENWYDLILDDFSFSKSDDELSARVLNEKINKKGKFDISHIHFPHQCIIFGAGPSIKRHIAYLKSTVNLDKYILIAADGATTALLEEGIIPDIIVTDLDGNMNDIILSNREGSIVYVHAHGDNIEKIEKYMDKLDKIIPTCQCKSFGNLENYGGFTDGDRAVHIALYSLNVNRIILAGMDFGDTVTHYSRPEINSEMERADDFKKKKLEYAQKLINSLKKENVHIEFIDLNDSI
ncbi:MAG: 6-hydroxymethyl-7,8-dihydropterin pyrophosphokinase [Methanosphaera sp. rholeuAM6]|nr:MAG: 6-hydroxymethyl-7,8-dihydropterin pyrophosphokinase [Methanosphaera sp. rholeuAM6]